MGRGTGLAFSPMARDYFDAVLGPDRRGRGEAEKADPITAGINAFQS